jgi:hypothetical protein
MIDLMAIAIPIVAAWLIACLLLAISVNLSAPMRWFQWQKWAKRNRVRYDGCYCHIYYFTDFHPGPAMHGSFTIRQVSTRPQADLALREFRRRFEQVKPGNQTHERTIE